MNNKDNNKPVRAKIFIYLLIILVSFIGILFASKVYKTDTLGGEDILVSSETNISNWAENIEYITGYTNRGVIAEDKNNIFYISEGKIFCLDKKKQNISEIVDGYVVYGLFLADDYLYFLTDKDAIFRVGLSGEDELLVWDKTYLGDSGLEYLGVLDFFVHKNILYIQSTGISFIKHNIREKTTELFADDVSSYGVVDDYFYYIDHGERTFSIFRKSLLTSEIELVKGEGVTFEDNNCVMFDRVIEAGNELYYTTRVPTKLYKYGVNVEDTLIEDLSDDVMYLYSNGEKLYFAYNVGVSGNVFCYNSETNGVEIVDKVEGFDISRPFEIHGKLTTLGKVKGGHVDPTAYLEKWGYDMDMFRDLVEEYMK